MTAITDETVGGDKVGKVDVVEAGGEMKENCENEATPQRLWSNDEAAERLIHPPRSEDPIGINLRGLKSEAEFEEAVKIMCELIPENKVEIISLGGESSINDANKNLKTFDLSPILSRFSNLKSLEFQHADLEDFPSWLGEFPGLTSVTCDGCPLNDVKSWREKLGNMQHIVITNTGLTNFPQAMDSLTTLVIHDAPRFTRLCDEMNKMQNLRMLSINGSALEELPNAICFLNGLEVLDLSDNRLFNLPIDFGNLFGLKSLILNRNRFDFLPKQLYKLAGLVRLEAQHNTISEIAADINNFKSLQKLSLDYNSIDTLPPEAFNFPEMQQYSISHNRLELIPDYVGEMWQMTRLDLSHNQLAAVPAEIAMCVGLRILDVSANKLTALPLDIRALKDLQDLNASDNQIAEFPSVLCLMESLQSIRLNANLIASLPEEFARLAPTLRSLDLSNNKLPSLPRCICECIHLNRLTVSDNQLNSLPPELKNLTELSHLDLSHNRFSQHFPNQICQMTTLETLNLSHNKFASLPTDIEKLRNLRQIDISANQLSFLPCEIVLLPKLKQLTCSSQKSIDRFEIPIEIGNSEVASLEMIDCKIYEIPVSIGRMKHLEYLNLSRNHFIALPDEICNLEKLRFLDVSNCMLRGLPNNFDQLRVKSFDLTNNPLRNPPYEVISDSQMKPISNMMRIVEEREAIILRRIVNLIADNVTKQELKMLQRKLKVASDFIQKLEKSMAGKDKLKDRAEATLNEWIRIGENATSKYLSWVIHVLDFTLIDRKIDRLHSQANFLKL